MDRSGRTVYGRADSTWITVAAGAALTVDLCAGLGLHHLAVGTPLTRFH
jgi:hypothetical protein